MALVIRGFAMDRIQVQAGGYDPAHGSSVLLPFVTDAMGFFLFLGLATALLL
jgi:magnesium transporter